MRSIVRRAACAAAKSGSAFSGFGFDDDGPVQVIASKSSVGRKLIAIELAVVGREVDQADRRLRRRG